MSLYNLTEYIYNSPNNKLIKFALKHQSINYDRVVLFQGNFLVYCQDYELDEVTKINMNYDPPIISNKSKTYFYSYHAFKKRNSIIHYDKFWETKLPVPFLQFFHFKIMSIEKLGIGYQVEVKSKFGIYYRFLQPASNIINVIDINLCYILAIDCLNQKIISVVYNTTYKKLITPLETIL